MGLIGALARTSLAVVLGTVEVAQEVYERYTPAPLAPLEGEPWDQADDLWPEEPVLSLSAPEVACTQHWGLQLPSGQVAWDCWSGVEFSEPLDRMLMVARLQKTGLDLGFAEDQLGEFLCRYRWVTRNQITVDTGTYPLLDPVVSAPDLAVEKNDNASEIQRPSESDNHAPSRDSDPDPGLHRRPVGGDA